jgi:integrase
MTDRRWIVIMVSKANLKKYLAVGGRWQFVPVLKINGKPRPEAVNIGGKTVKGTTGTYYVEWREHGKRVQKPVGRSPREALDAWRTRNAILEGAIEAPEETDDSLPIEHVSIESAVKIYLTEIKGTKAEGTYDAYRADLDWFKATIKRATVGKVTRSDIMQLFAAGREEGLSQASINRRVMVGMMAVRNAGATVKLKKGDWPKVSQGEVEIYEDDEIRAFFAACDPEERLIFKTYLVSGFRNREVATLTDDSVLMKSNKLGVKERPAYKFKPKSYEARTVPVPASFMEELKQWKKKSSGPLVFPTPPHPKRPSYGGDQPNAHHLEMCKQIAFRAGLNCGHCVTSKGKCAKGPYCERWYLHKWRHTFATNMLQSGVDIKSLQVLLGHKHLSTTERYLKSLRLDDLRDKVEASTLAALVA